MKLFKFLFKTSIGIFVLLALFQCGMIFNNSATIRIDLGGTQAAMGAALTKGVAPSNITGYTLTVTGAGMEPIVKNFVQGTSIVAVMVPPGPDRKIELEANLDLGKTNAPLYSFMGTSHTDLAPNEVKAISLRMIPGRTKLLIPDLNNNKLVQMDDMTGAHPLSFAPVSASPILFPNDVDMDAQGRIYIGYEYTTSYYIVRLNSIDDTSPMLIPTSDIPDVIAIDKINNFLYYFNRSHANIMRIRLNQISDPPVGEESIDLFSEGVPNLDGLSISGIDADADGNIYFNERSAIVKFNPLAPVGSRLVKVFPDPSSIVSSPFDFCVKDQYVYVSNIGGADGYKILKFSTKNFDFIGGAGNAYIPPQPPPVVPASFAGDFYGPKRFIALTNKDVYIIDETSVGLPTGGSQGYNRIVEFSDIDWGIWNVREAVIDGFKFYDGF